jgi:glucokinase
LADATGWPILTLDTIKNPFLTRMPPSDKQFNLTLGQASYDAIFDLIGDAPDGTNFIIDAWFGFQPLETLSAGIARAGLTDLAEVWCHAPPETIGARYQARLHLRPAGHPGAEYVPELTALAACAKPTGLGSVAGPFEVDTTRPIDLNALTQWLRVPWP